MSNIIYSKKEIFVRNIDFVLLFLIGLACMFYSFLKKYFAEVNIQPPFLDFPIFIGEILLGICLVLSIIKLSVTFPHKIKKWYVTFIVYIIFMLSKAFIGYFQYGPLAFRHAAMFYYPLFATISYYAFRKNLFSDFIRVLLFISSIFIIRYVYVSLYLYLYVMMGLILALTFKAKIIRYLSITAILVTIPYYEFFQGGRTILVTSLLAFIILSAMLLVVINIKKMYKILLLALVTVSMIVTTLSLGYKGNILTLIKPKQFIQIVNQYDEYIEEQKGKFEFKAITPKLYNPNKKIVGFSRLGDPYTALDITPALEVSQPEKTTQKEVSPQLLIKDKTRVTSDEIPALEVSQPEWVAQKQVSTELTKKEISKTKLVLEEKISSKVSEIMALERLPDDVFKRVEGDMNLKFGTMLFRVNTLRDILDQLWAEKPLLGFDFGKPFRSKRIEITKSAYGEWSRDGWIDPHNSYIDIVYRAGLFGIILIVLLFLNVLWIAKIFLKASSKIGVLLVNIIFFWLLVCLFMPIFELPYYAIAFWSLYGWVLAFSHKVKTLES